VSQHPDASKLCDKIMIISVSIQYQTDNPDRKGGFKSHTGEGGMVFMNSITRLHSDQNDDSTKMEVIFCLKSREVSNLQPGKRQAEEGQNKNRMEGQNKNKNALKWQ